MTERPPSFDLELPAVIVEAERRYLLGFPLVIAVTFDNGSGAAEFFALPELHLLVTRAAVSLQLEPTKGGAPLSIKPSPTETGVPSPSVSLGPGERRRMALDLSNLGLDIQPGTYRLTLGLHVGRYARWSDPVPVEFVQPSDQDAQEATRLRRLGVAPTDTGAWAPFLTRNWNTVQASPQTSPDAVGQMALHLFLHRALYAPDSVAQLDPAPLKKITSPILSVEAAVLEYEILHARNDVTARDKLGQTLLSRWPGLRYRLERIRRGEGFLTNGRRWFGAERVFNQPPSFYPYKN